MSIALPVDDEDGSGDLSLFGSGHGSMTTEVTTMEGPNEITTPPVSDNYPGTTSIIVIVLLTVALIVIVTLIVLAVRYAFGHRGSYKVKEQPENIKIDENKIESNIYEECAAAEILL